MNFEHAIDSKGSSLMWLDGMGIVEQFHDLSVLLDRLQDDAPDHAVTQRLAAVMRHVRSSFDLLEQAEDLYKDLQYPLCEWARQYENGHQNPLENGCVQARFAEFEAKVQDEWPEMRADPVAAPTWRAKVD